MQRHPLWNVEIPSWKLHGSWRTGFLLCLLSHSLVTRHCLGHICVFYGKWRYAMTRNHFHDSCPQYCDFLVILFICTEKQKPKICLPNKYPWRLFRKLRVLICFSEPVNELLSWKGWIPLSRLTYCAYLTHVTCEYILVTSFDSLPHWTNHFNFVSPLIFP